MSFWSRYNRPSRKDAEELIGDRRKGFTVIASGLANYACNLAVARGCREEGKLDSAEIYDYSVKLCFDRLPPDVQAEIRRSQR